MNKRKYNKLYTSITAALVLILGLMTLLLSGCSYAGYDAIDTNYHFDKAIIRMPDDTVITVDIEKWADSSDGEQLTITSKDGTRYLVSSFNCILIEDANS